MDGTPGHVGGGAALDVIDNVVRTPPAPPLLRLQGITKTFPGVKALDQVDFALAAGEVHVLFGENGAGKSTLINVIAGVLEPDAGKIELSGATIKLTGVQDVRRRGISAMFQEFSLAPDLTVAENLLLGSEPSWCGIIQARHAETKARQALEQHGIAIDPHAVTGHLGRAEQQLVEMVKALLREPQILILDEPTASLSERETAILFQTLRALKARGAAIIYITHRMREIWEIADRVTVMRDGRHVGTVAVAETSEDRLIEMMTGRAVADLYPRIQHHGGRTILQMDRVSSRSGRIHDVSLELREGEIVGLAGLVGCGKSNIGRICFGLENIASGSIMVDGRPITATTPRQMLDQGLCYITSDRRAEGLLLGRSSLENITLAALPLQGFSAGGVVRSRQEAKQARALAARVQLRPPHMTSPAANFSGGNQQKMVIARALAVSSKVLIFDEPTVGVDVGARGEIYRVLAEMVHEGRSILLISSDLPEILHLCNRVYVVSHGRIVDRLVREEIDEARILRGFFRETNDHQEKGAS